MVQVNPYHTKRIKEVLDNSPGKSDPKDTHVIGMLMQLGSVLQVVVPRGAAAELRRLIHERERLLQDRTALYNRLHSKVFVLFPEFIQIMKNIKSKSARYLLSTVPTPESILDRGYTWLQRSVHRISRGKLKRDCVKQLYEAAQTSAGIHEGREGLLLTVSHILQQVELIESQRAETEKMIRYHLSSVPESQYIMSLKGVGEITTAALIGEIGDFNAFGHYREIEKLAGYNLYFCSSGKYQGQRRISKRGRALLRKVLYFSALSLVRKGGIFHKEYQALLARGKKKPVALTNIAKKTLRLVYALVRDKREYEHDYNPLTKGLPKAA